MFDILLNGVRCLHSVTRATVLLSVMAACGGGSSGGGSSGGGSSGGVPQSPTVPAYDYSQGTASSESNANQAITSSAIYSLPYDAPNGSSYASVGVAHQTLNGGNDFVATVDTGARTAWQSGWTGKNVKIGIADSFNSNGRVDSHGDWVAVVSTSVAPESTLGFQDILSNSTLVGILGDAAAAYDYFETNSYHIINNSWGIERPKRNSNGSYSGSLYADFDDLVSQTVAAFDPNTPSSAQGLYIMAGGNGGQYCPTREIQNCNWVAATTDKIRENGYAAGPRLIFVGSLEDNSNNLASYSYYAGDLKEDFLVAHDDILSSGDAAGTSFAAPRVAGAAAIVKQKFPNLTSSQIKQVLLQTADDLGDVGVDRIYGYGKLNIANSLSPQGRVIPK